jgi:anti-anti-sigma factor
MEFEDNGDGLRCVFPPTVDTASADAFESDLYGRIEQTTGPIVFDLRDISYAGSAFLRICVNTIRKIGKDRLCLVNVPPAVRKVIEVSHLAGQLTIR